MAETPRTDAAQEAAMKQFTVGSRIPVQMMAAEMGQLETELNEVKSQLAAAQKEARAFYALSEERMRIIEATRRQLAELKNETPGS